MGIYAIANLAGSVGKSTTAASLAVKLALEGKRVRLIDFDAQANATTWTGYEIPPGQPTMADVLHQRRTLDEVSVPVDKVPGLILVPGRRDALDAVSVELTAKTGAELRFLTAIERSKTDVDHTLIDCAGSFSVQTVAAILATQANNGSPGHSGVITCTQPMLKENEGIPELEKQLHEINETYRRNAALLAIIPCIVPPDNAGDIYTEQLDDLRELYGDRVTPPIRRSSAVPEAYTFGTPLPLYGYRARGVNEDYTKVLDHLRELGCLL